MTQETATTLFIPATRLGEYPNYQMDSNKTYIPVDLRKCDVCDLPCNECYNRYTTDGAWNTAHKNRMTTRVSEPHVWIVRYTPDEVKVEYKDNNKRMKV